MLSGENIYSADFFKIQVFFSFLVPGIDGSALAEASLTDSYFSTSFIGVNGFGSPAETKYPMIQVMPPLVSPYKVLQITICL